MAELPTDRASLDEYMGVWFRGEVPDTVELRSTAVIFRKELEEMIESRRLHLEKVRGCSTYGWLKRLKENHAEDLDQLFSMFLWLGCMQQFVSGRMMWPRWTIKHA
ncbi:hypothetical protein Tco_1318431 [Tanacetum coccineum]